MDLGTRQTPKYVCDQAAPYKIVISTYICAGVPQTINANQLYVANRLALNSAWRLYEVRSLVIGPFALNIREMALLWAMPRHGHTEVHPFVGISTPPLAHNFCSRRTNLPWTLLK